MTHIYQNYYGVIIFSNTDLSANVQATVKRQLDLTEMISAAEFDARVAADPNYPNIVHLNRLRIWVLRDLSDQTNRNLADLVLFLKAGLASVLFHKSGMPTFAIPIDRMYLSALFARDFIPEFFEVEDDEIEELEMDDEWEDEISGGGDDDEILPISEQIELEQNGGVPPCPVEQIEADRAADDFQSITDEEAIDNAIIAESGISD
jgi:hypothetical protein